MTCMNTIRGRVGAISYLVAGGCLVVWWRMHVQTELPLNSLPLNSLAAAGRTVLEVLSDFKSVQLPLEWLLQVCAAAPVTGMHSIGSGTSGSRVSGSGASASACALLFTLPAAAAGAGRPPPQSPLL